MKRLLFILIIVLALAPSVCFGQMRSSRGIPAPSPLESDGSGGYTLPGSLAIGTMDLGVSVYATAATGVTIDPDPATEHVVNLAGANATTGVSLIFLTPTQQANKRRTITLVTHGTGVLSWPGINLQFASGTSPTPTSGTTNIYTCQYNNITNVWRITDGPYDMRSN